jgi:hypothetical protein
VRRGRLFFACPQWRSPEYSQPAEGRRDNTADSGQGSERVPFSDPFHIGEHAFWIRVAIPCSAVAQQRHKIIRNGVALAGEESVSVGHQRHLPPGPIRRTHPCASSIMR